MSLEEHSAKRAQLAAISKPVWEAFFQGGVPIAPETRALVREYRQLFLQTTNEEVAGYTTAAAAEFFHWLDASAQ